MAKRKSKPTIEEVRSLREQAEAHIFDVLMQFEDITGLQVDGIENIDPELLSKEEDADHQEETASPSVDP